MQKLSPSIDCLSQEYVLVQAWKKASNHIRYHNWFSDTLELDIATADLPDFISSLSKEIREGAWEPDKLRLVPAPKGQSWFVGSNGRWRPTGGNSSVKLRPLAHASIRDQVVTTAIMLCLADRIETAQGDTRAGVTGGPLGKSVVSYGNRLFCDREGKGLTHRWGSSKLYRQYYTDYQAFLTRPESVAEELTGADNIQIIQSDLSQFYDRVRPDFLHRSLTKFQQADDDPEFFRFVKSVLNWQWHKNDVKAAEDYARQCDIEGFQNIALPQGLVSAGFFANVVLIDFDEALSALIGTEIMSGIRLHDAIRYVDDLRLVISHDNDVAPINQAAVSEWLQEILGATTSGLQVSPEKTKIASFRGEERPLLRQSRKMARLQAAVSGGFDAAKGTEIIGAVQGLVRAQARFSVTGETQPEFTFAPIPDVRDETVGRFAAARFRTTYRSLRPMLEQRTIEETHEREAASDQLFAEMSAEELDDEAQAFALGLIDQWVNDPSNVRLLRIGLDLWPAREILESILDLIRPYISGNGRGKARKVACYCLSEIFRAGATETGLVQDDEQLPNAIDPAGYRSLLAEEAAKVANSSSSALPWFLKQQAFLCVAALEPGLLHLMKRGNAAETKSYRNLICFLNEKSITSSSSEFAALSIVARRSFLNAENSVRITEKSLSDLRYQQIAKRDPNFAAELRPLEFSGPPSARGNEGQFCLLDICHDSDLSLRTRNEITIASFASGFVEACGGGDLPATIRPQDVIVHFSHRSNHMVVERVEVIKCPDAVPEDIYSTPSWCSPEEKWKFQLGYLLRFILTARFDFTEVVRSSSWRENENVYRPTRSHWFQRHYGFFNGHGGFGDDWLPISAAVEDVLFTLLAWPGCRTEGLTQVSSNLDRAKIYFRELLTQAEACVGASTGLLMLKMKAPLTEYRKTSRPLRGCVVQTITPSSEDFVKAKAGIDLNEKEIRRRHRNHLSTALMAVDKMLALRETHKPQNGRLDWLILPELSVHPADVHTHLVPFARRHRTIILAGMTFQRLLADAPFVNSALWIVPHIAPGRGLQMLIRRQGKHHMAPMEKSYEKQGLVHGFRPAQWLVGYDWGLTFEDPLWLTAAICYDATDICLASDLRSRSDVFAIPAFNKDVGTFDQMAMALHYHMYQMVLIANNGQYGGSNAYAPFKEPFLKQVFHSHGQPQASISFFELDDIQAFKSRHTDGKKVAKDGGPKPSDPSWKFPPAGM